MPVNPATQSPSSTSPVDRSLPINDPQYKHLEGYTSFDLTSEKVISPRFGEITPCFYSESTPADRHRLMDTSLHILNQIDANMFSKVRSYTNYIFTPFRCLMPNNYEKLITNPTKGDDLPQAALPIYPLTYLLRAMLHGAWGFKTFEDDSVHSYSLASETPFENTSINSVYINQLIYISYVLSRGSLLDYLGYSVDTLNEITSNQSEYAKYRNLIQSVVDKFWHSLYKWEDADGMISEDATLYIRGLDITVPALEDVSNYEQSHRIDLNVVGNSQVKVQYKSKQAEFDLPSFRACLYDCIERGLFIDIFFYEDGSRHAISTGAAIELIDCLEKTVFPTAETLDVNADFTTDRGVMNPLRVAAYQLSVAEYYTNDQVDNIYTAELYMQNLRSLMFPSDLGVSSEPVFNYNGVPTEYDLFSLGAVYHSFLSNRVPGEFYRALPYISCVFGMRRSLRYGDYFSTGRPNLLATGGQMSIKPNDDGTLDPVVVNQGLLFARYKNASNWIGSKFSNYMPAMYGVQPSDQGTKPYWFASRTIELNRDFVNNTAEDQGRQVTNLRGTSDNEGFDAFFDDYGVMLGFLSYDVLPLYPAGIDPHFRNFDRFSLFNPMLQNVGDQPIYRSELTGEVRRADVPFAYVVRYGEYKMTHNRAHGAFVNSLPGFAMLYPAGSFVQNDSEFVDSDVTINPEFIRDKPWYFDQFFASRQGISPGDYFHFAVGVTNVHEAARKMQYTPLVL